MPDRLQKQVKRILDYERYYHPKSPIICHTAREIIYPDNNQLIAPTMGDNESEIAPNGMPVAEYILLGKPLKNSYGGCPTCSQMMRLSTYKDIGGFDINFRRSEDTELNIRLAKNGTHFVGISEPLVIQKMTKTIDKDIDLEIKYLLMVLRKHKNITDHHNLYHFCYRWIITKKHWLKKNYLRFIYYMLINFITNPFHSFKRLYYSIRNIELNRNFRYFHKSKSC